MNNQRTKAFMDSGDDIAVFSPNRPCNCGSGLEKYPLHDARGIFCTYCCDQCETEKRKQYRAEIFTDSNYSADEPIEPEEVW